MKLFYSEMFFGLDLEGITSYGQKHFHETIIVCARKALRKQQINKKIMRNYISCRATCFQLKQSVPK